MVELAGAEMLSKTMFVQAFTTDVIWAYSVAVHEAGALPTAANVVLVAFTMAAEESLGFAALDAATTDLDDVDAAEALLETCTWISALVAFTTLVTLLADAVETGF